MSEFTIDPEKIKKFKKDYPHLSNLSPLKMMLRLCHIPRWGIIPMARPQSVGEHSFRVAAIAASLVDRIGKFETLTVDFLHEVVWESIIHDCEEAVSGDIPSPYRKLLGIDAERLARELCPDMPGGPVREKVKWLVKMADTIEASTYLRMWGRSVDGVDIREVKAANVQNHLSPRLDSCPFKDRMKVESVVFELMEEICGE